MASAGLDYQTSRTDFDYGGHLSDTLRFHVGGFYREGTGPRPVGYTAERGGQLKFNVSDDATLVGNKPRHQAALIYQLMPQYDTDLFTLGADIVGTTGSYTQDTNQLRMPGYTTVNLFLQVRPMPRVEVSLNANNVFNVLGLTDMSAATLPAGGVTTAKSIYGRMISSSLRFYF